MSTTLKSIPVTVSPDGSVILSEPLVLLEPVAAMLTIALDDGEQALEPALLSEVALDDWNNEAENKAWEYLSEVI